MASNSRPAAHRGLSQQIRQHRARAEEEHLLASQHDEEEHADGDGLYPPHCCWTSDQTHPPPAADRFGIRKCNVYENIHRIRRDILGSIDDPYSLEQLKAPRMNVSVVRPLVEQFYNMQDLSIVYCLLINRIQFIREQSVAAHHQTVNLTRALLCELVAEKILRRYNEHNPGPKGLLKLAHILVAGFEPFQNAPQEVICENPRAIYWAVQKKAGAFEKKLTALEIAIVSESKSFLASSACQKVVDAIYRGKIVYTPNSFIDIIPDHWKKRPISLYDPRRGPVLNQYRLIVPRTRNLIEVCQFVILLILYFIVMAGRETRMTTKYTLAEAIFEIYGTGWVLDQIASILEHGWQVYTQNLWSFLDVMFSFLFIIYLGLRIHSLVALDDEKSTILARTALDVLSCGAPVLIPRLAFNVMSENMLFLSLRAMMSDFLTLTLLAVWSFAGFLLSLKWLHNGVHQSITIGKWMIWIWFGLDGTGIEQSPDFHWFLGPAMMIMFAFLGNTLFLTILVSMLSNTFSMIAGNSVQEIQYRRAVLTFEGVKSDAIFAYMPPFNILALIFVLPLKLATTPRMFHKINVTAVRTLTFPILLVIAWYERRTLWMSEKRKHLPTRSVDWKNSEGSRLFSLGWWASTVALWNFSRFSVRGDVQAVFDIEPPQSVLDRIDEEADLDPANGVGRSLLEDFNEHYQNQTSISSRKPSTATDTARRRSVSLKDNKETRPGSKTSDPLRQEFQDSSDDTDEELDHAKGYRKMRRGERKDSLIDYNDTGGSHLQEANTRLHKLEESIKRIEAMLVQALEGGSEDSDKGQQQLEEDAEAGISR